MTCQSSRTASLVTTDQPQRCGVSAGPYIRSAAALQPLNGSLYLSCILPTESTSQDNMLCWRGQPLSSCLLAAALFGGSAIGRESTLETCKLRVERILNGTETFGAISNETIGPFLYTGPVHGISFVDGQISRDDFITITTQGMSLDLGLSGIV